ncbi:MAG: hypothetical protein HRU20_20100 [Pseudomonadales bacterium]|nr:hypothetical protein [Pseudomonadales bacterium]
MESEFIGDLILGAVYSFIALLMVYMLWRGLTNGKRAANNQCPRCGVDLENRETKLVRVGNGTKFDEHIMCLECAEITKTGPKWLWVMVITTLVGTFIMMAILD